MCNSSTRCTALFGCFSFFCLQLTHMWWHEAEQLEPLNESIFDLGCLLASCCYCCLYFLTSLLTALALRYRVSQKRILVNAAVMLHWVSSESWYRYSPPPSRERTASCNKATNQGDTGRGVALRFCGRVLLGYSIFWSKRGSKRGSKRISKRGSKRKNLIQDQFLGLDYYRDHLI